jgi:hypothetical protein
MKIEDDALIKIQVKTDEGYQTIAFSNLVFYFHIINAMMEYSPTEKFRAIQDNTLILFSNE